MSDRLTVDTITSDQLAALQLQAARMEHATKQYAELRVRLEDTEHDAERYKADCLAACKTIAEMHAAAVGRGDLGPIRGVVEDVEDVRLRAERAETAIKRVRAARDRMAHAKASEVDAIWCLDLVDAALAGSEQPTTEAEQAKTARVLSALHRSAEDDVTRVIALYERWVTAGPPPLGAPLARWWDARLIELRQAIRPPEEEPVIGAESTVDAERLVDQNGKPICTCTYGERCSNCRD